MTVALILDSTGLNPVQSKNTLFPLLLLSLLKDTRSIIISIQKLGINVTTIKVAYNKPTGPNFFSVKMDFTGMYYKTKRIFHTTCST
jgi:hypothetical protein